MSGNTDKRPDDGRSDRREKLLYVAAIMLLAGALVLSEAGRLAQRSAQDKLAVEIEATRKNADAALRAVIAPETLSEADKSVYMIATDRTFIGTAFVIDRDRGVLATAAHVAEALPLEDEDHTIRAINQFTGKPLRVRIAKKHAGYGAFTRIAERYQPIDSESPIVNPRAIALSDYANDAALLIVDPIDVETGENVLGPNLPIAAEEDLYNLKAGDAIAVIGFPSDTLTAGVADKSAASRIERGVIAAMVSPIDLADQSADVKGRNLIVHRMATAPGTSGGPIINGEGEVVGVNTHGLSSPFSNGDKMGQRAEVLYDLLAALREEIQIDRVYAPDWRRRLSRWKKARDVIPYMHYFVSRLDRQPTVGSLQVAGVDYDAPAPFRSQIIDLKFDDVRESYTVYAADLASPVIAQPAQAASTSGPNRLAAQATPLFRLAQSGEYREMVFDLPADEQHVIYAFDYAVNTYYGFCPTAIHHREIGKSELILGRPAGSPSVRIEATGAAGTRKRVQALFHRPNCATSSDFFAGVISWKPETPAAPAKTAAGAVVALFNKAACTMGADGCVRKIKASFEDGNATHAVTSSVDRLVPIVSIPAAGPDAAHN